MPISSSPCSAPRHFVASWWRRTSQGARAPSCWEAGPSGRRGHARPAAQTISTG
ncbi:hypothetical protein T484DRAFT_1944801 [Baffinella frigidus]|nr:hypothetical protein T484DRAFT_1944801 [Cryptophyta sp. CCMP2293]